MSALRSGDYQGAVDFEDGELIVKILHIDDIVTTTIDSAAAAQAAFEELVKDYADSCRELGKEPCRPFKGSFNVRVSPELHRQVAMAAADANETMNAWIAQALQARVDGQRAGRSALDPAAFARLLGVDTLNLQYESIARWRVVGGAGERPMPRDRFAIPPALAKQMSN